MPEESSFEPSNDLHNDRFTQISESHCGPAVVQMLLHHLGIEVTQEAVAEAGGAVELIELFGMRIDQLQRAVGVLAPQTRFWYKDHATIEELVQVTGTHHYPVGIEWQGLFEDSPEDEIEGGDYGHYSVVLMADSENQRLAIVDPYKEFRSQDRVLAFDFFTSRWWDMNEVRDPLTGDNRLVEDRQMMFVITPEEETFPHQLGMKSE
jgi:hypothetical protein